MGTDKQESKGVLARMVKRVVAWLRTLLITILAQGQIPKHVAFIMDGNRRYAKKKHIAKIQGHADGFTALEKILDWCMDLGIKEVSVYAFSIENFKRPQEEVDSLMELAAEKFSLMMQENQMIDKLGIRVRAIGDLSLIPAKTRQTIDKVVEYSRDNTRATLNVCFAYTARDEMARAVRKITDTALRARDHLHTGQLHINNHGNEREAPESRLVKLVQGGEGALVALPPGKDATWGEEASGKEQVWGWEDELWNAMDIDNAPELLVRTSGEIRFSDFMLWQTAFSCVVFLNVLWPNFTLWHFIYVILVFQSNYNVMKAKRKYYANNVKNYALAEKELNLT